MEQQINKTYSPLFTKHPRYFFLMGGRGAGRSTVASQFALSKLIAPEYFRCAIMRYVLGDIRNSIYREITDRIEEKGIGDELDINDSLMTIKYGANSVNAVGFKKSSGEQKAKLKSLANYNCVIIEEADEIPEEDFMQLDDSLRTLKGNITIIFLLNPPPKSHWILKRWFNLEPVPDLKDFYIPKLKPEMTDAEFIGSNYLVNKSNIAQASIDSYERYKITKPEHYYNMVKGYVPEVVRGKVYSNWQEIELIPHEARLERYGLDYGYSNDPTAIIAVYYYNGGFIFDEIMYQKGKSNKQIADALLSIDKALVIPDSAEPKSNDELISYGVDLIPAQKGQGSLNHGIQKVKSQQISYTKRSIHLKEEYENYAWDMDKDTGEFKNVPKDVYNHAMDAIRYALETLVHDDDEQEQADRLLARLRNTPSQVK